MCSASRPQGRTIGAPMQPALSTPITQPPVSAWGELSEKPRLGFTSKKTAWHPAPSVCNSTTALGLRSGCAGNRVRSFCSGEQYDPDLGLYYLRARYMNPATGRFMSRDPIDGDTFQPVTLHKYLYAGGDPINWLDPSGKAAIFEYKFTIGGIGIRVALDPANHLFDILGKLYLCIHLQLNTWIPGQKGSDWAYRIPLIPLCVAAGP